LLHTFAGIRDAEITKRVEAKAVGSFAIDLSQMNRLSSEGVYSLRLAELTSRVHTLIGQTIAGELATVPDAALHFAQAYVMDPSNGVARQLLRESADIPHKLREALREAQAKGTVRPDAGALIAGIERGVARALAYLESSEATAVHELRREDAVPELARRLQLDPADDQVTARLRHLDETLCEISAEAHGDIDDRVSLVRTRATARDPALADLPWERLAPVLIRVVPSDLEALTLLAPPAPLASLEPVRDRIRQAEVGAGWGRDFSQPSLRVRGARWLFSRRDAGYKVAALIGLVLIGITLAMTANRTLEDRRYDHVLALAAGDEGAGLVAASLDFLEGTTVSEDARRPQVIELLDRGIARVLASPDGQRDSVRLLDLFRRYQRLDASQ
jgi:hypothetical protein